MRLCANLRWKGWYGQRWPTPEALTQALQGSDSQFSCLASCQAWGPDDGLVEPGACQPGRRCFALSPRDPSRLSS